jgi:staphylococcal nuclease domain-containing protein 1
MATNVGMIKEVLSGDTVKIIGKSMEDGPPPEITITLASVLAPRLKGGVAEEPYAWESRDFLRELCIGKRVQFKVVQVVNAINR